MQPLKQSNCGQELTINKFHQLLKQQAHTGQSVCVPCTVSEYGIQEVLHSQIARLNFELLLYQHYRLYSYVSRDVVVCILIRVW